MRKNKRFELGSLNHAFAAFCRDAEAKLCAKIEVGKRAFNPPAGDVYTFGSGDCGQLALSESVLDASRPRPIVNLHNLQMTDVACGGLHNAALTDAGAVYSWGCNDEGSLGIASVETGFAPLMVCGFTPSATEIAKGLDCDLSCDLFPTWKGDKEIMIMAAAGDCQTLTLSTTGRVYFFGCYKCVEGNAWRDLTPPDDIRVHPNPEKRNQDAAPCGKQFWPIHVWNMPGKVLNIDCGCSFNAAIVEMPNDNDHASTDRVCVTWGLGETGELARPVRKGIKHSNYSPKKGDGPYANYHVDWVKEDYVVPKPVLWEEDPKPGFKRVVEFIACGGYHLLVIARDVNVQDDASNSHDGESAVYGSGLNQYGQLGLGMNTNVEKLTRVSMECMHVSFQPKHDIQ